MSSILHLRLKYITVHTNFMLLLMLCPWQSLVLLLAILHIKCQKSEFMAVFILKTDQYVVSGGVYVETQV